MVPEADNKALVTNPWHDIYRWHFHLGEIDPCGLQGFEDVFAREPSPRLYTHTLRSANVKLSSTSSGRNALRCKCLITNPIFSLVVNISTPQCWKSTKAASSSLFAAFSYRDSIQFAVWPCNFCGAGHGEKKLERGSASTGESSAACHLFLRPETNLLEFWWAKIYSRVLWFGGREYFCFLQKIPLPLVFFVSLVEGIFQQWFNLDTKTDPRMPAGDLQSLVSRFEQVQMGKGHCLWHLKMSKSAL